MNQERPHEAGIALWSCCGCGKESFPHPLACAKCFSDEFDQICYSHAIVEEFTHSPGLGMWVLTLRVVPGVRVIGRAQEPPRAGQEIAVSGDPRSQESAYVPGASGPGVNICEKEWNHE